MTQMKVSTIIMVHLAVGLSIGFTFVQALFGMSSGLLFAMINNRFSYQLNN